MYLVSLDPADPYPKFVKTRSWSQLATRLQEVAYDVDECRLHVDVLLFTVWVAVVAAAVGVARSAAVRVAQDGSHAAEGKSQLSTCGKAIMPMVFLAIIIYILRE